jgi:hypothetical protein
LGLVTRGDDVNILEIVFDDGQGDFWGFFGVLRRILFVFEGLIGFESFEAFGVVSKSLQWSQEGSY